MKKCLLSGLLILLSACGSGGGGSKAVVNVSSDGIWNGTFHSNYTNTDYQATGIVVGNEARFVNPQGTYQYAGNISTSGSNLSGTLNSYTNGQLSEALGIGGSAQTAAFMNGTYTGNAGDTGTFSFTYNTLYDSPSSTSLFDGFSWQGPKAGGGTVSLSFSQGQFTGQDTNLCTYNGTISIIDSTHNVYRLNTTVNCGTGSAGYNGLGFFADISDDTFIFNISNSSGNSSVTAEVYKQQG